MMVKQLAAALSNAQEYINLAAKAEDGGERERYERIAELYLKITPRLAARGGPATRPRIGTDPYPWLGRALRIRRTSACADWRLTAGPRRIRRDIASLGICSSRGSNGS